MREFRGTVATTGKADAKRILPHLWYLASQPAATPRQSDKRAALARHWPQAAPVAIGGDLAAGKSPARAGKESGSPNALTPGQFTQISNSGMADGKTVCHARHHQFFSSWAVSKRSRNWQTF